MLQSAVILIVKKLWKIDLNDLDIYRIDRIEENLKIIRKVIKKDIEINNLDRSIILDRIL